jgi:16S rRNA pseudouridine516 synthase
MRLDKYIASVTELSRKQARECIRDGRVAIDESVARAYQFQLGANSRVTLDGNALRAVGLRYFMLHKPPGVICATRDSHHTTVIDLLTVAAREKLQIAGRLDIDTTGLVLLTDDGQWNHRLTSPRRQCIKEYRVTTAQAISTEAVERLTRGVTLLPENRVTRPARLELTGSHQATLFISEGRYHQVKRMFAAVGNAVTRLHRSAVGDIRLDETLPPGEFRPLSPAEIEAI